jgi:hypothetical protein
MRLMEDAKGNTYKVNEADVKRYTALGYTDAGAAKELDSIAGPDDDSVEYDSGSAEGSGANTKPRRRGGATKPAKAPDSPKAPGSGSGADSGSSTGGSDTTTTITPAGGTVSAPKPPAP